MKINDKHLLLSIICRSFNGEKYIFSALKSLAAHLDERSEVIIVDNGSTDKTIDVIEKFLSNEKYLFNVKLIKQKNAGPGGSSNTGLDNAIGKYVGFLDCDDIFLETINSEIINILEKEEIDIVEYGFVIFFDEKNINLKNYQNLYKNLNGKYFTSSILEVIFARTNWYPFTRFFKKGLWANHRFPLNKAYEDDMTLYKVFLDSKTIHIIDKPAIAYRNHSNSITARHTRKQLYDLINFYWELDIDNKYKNIFRLRLARAISHFSFELNEGRDQYKKIFYHQKKYKFPIKILLCFKKADIFYYFLPHIYDFLNFIRLKLRTYK